MHKITDLLEKLERLHPKYIDLSLIRINKLLKKLNDPHLQLPPCIHIAGTNGKGSILSFIKNIMIKSDYKVHAYISPHLEKINERFVVSNKIITNKKLFDTLEFVKKINGKASITFYEITTAAAFYLFSKYPADFVLLETGLGGRLDATNVLDDSLLSIIAPISSDHQEYLGTSIQKITKEKLGIIKKNSVVINSKQNKTVQKIIKNYIKNKKNKIISYGADWKIKKITNKYFYMQSKMQLTKYKIPSILGEHQIYNASTAITTIKYLIAKGYYFKNKNINKGIVNMFWPCRLEMIRKKKPIIILDGAHNIDGAKSLRKFILKSKYKTWVILGMLNTKDIYSYLKAIKSCVYGIIAIKIPHEKNSFSELEIKKHCDNLNIYCLNKINIENAIKELFKNNNVEQIIITGSLYLVGKTKKKIIKVLNQSNH